MLPSLARFPVEDHSLVDFVVVAVVLPADFQVSEAMSTAVSPVEEYRPAAASSLAEVQTTAEFRAAGFEVDKEVAGRLLAAARWMSAELAATLESTPLAEPALEEYSKPAAAVDWKHRWPPGSNLVRNLTG